MHIFGGYDGQCWLNDFYSLDLETFEWQKINQQGSLPSERFGFSSSQTGDFFYIFGGFDGTNWLNDFY